MVILVYVREREPQTCTLENACTKGNQAQFWKQGKFVKQNIILREETSGRALNNLQQYLGKDLEGK